MDVTVSASFDPSDLAVCWMELETRANGGFFLSWRWIGSWLRVTGAQPLLIKAEENGKTVGLGLLVRASRRRFALPVRQLCLNETGRPEWDSLMIEHNNFLVDRQAPPGLVGEMLKAVQAADPTWDEIVLGGVSAGVVASAEAAGLTVVTDRVSPDFGAVLAGRVHWQDSLSPNQRAQLRQSRSFAERMGPLALTAADNPSQAMAFFEKLVELHTAYWHGRGKPGAFAAPSSMAFHREIISAQEGPGQVELLQLSAGNQVLGYLYNFTHGDRAYSYQSGFSYSEDNRHRPGLLAHALAIEQAQARGICIYDFLAGEAPYKARLGRQTLSKVIWCRAQRDRPLLRCERAVRALYRGLKRA